MAGRLRVNVGCGQTPTTGWRNFDNSPSLRISKIPMLPLILRSTGFVNKDQAKFIQFAREHFIEFGDIIKAFLSIPARLKFSTARI